MLRILSLFFALVAFLPTAHAQLLAFPEAEGFGRYATGARTNLSAASIYHVTNLNDSGAGSLRDALSESNRFVVFDVGGIIHLESVMTVASNVTIAGQTAPGGVTVYSDRVAFHNANNLVSRHWAIRKGDPGVRDDAASIARGSNMIFDHMSITWGVDGTFDINPDSGYVIDDITIQNSVIAQGLDRLGHSTGGLMQPGSGGSVSVIKSLWADNVTRNPKVRNDNEFINNVVYGWESAAYIMGSTAGTSNANVMGNYFIEGPVNGSAPFSGGTSSFHIYADDNWVDGDRDGVLDGSLVTSYPGADVVSTPHSFPTPANLTAQQAVQHVMTNAGPHIVRDAVDTRLMEEVASYGALGGVIQRETDLFPGFGSDPAYFNPRARLVDVDNDAMADNWEAAHGLSSSDPNDWKTINRSGYTWLEVYLNELGADGVVETSTSGAWDTAATWDGGVPSLADDAQVAGAVDLASGNAFARRLNVSSTLNMTGGTLDVFDTATSNGSFSINNSTVTAGRVLIGSASRQSGTIAVGAGGVLQTSVIASGGGASALFFNGGTFRATEASSISVATTIDAGGATIDTAGYSGEVSGSISGIGGLTKQGAGSLTLSGSNSYAGPTVIEQGTLVAQGAGLGQTESITLDVSATLDATGISGGLNLGAGRSLIGAGTVLGAVTAEAGAVVRPRGEITSLANAIGVQAESLSLGSDWAVFDNAIHGSGAGGSYNGADLNGGGIVLVSGESTSAPSSNGRASTPMTILESGDWYLYAKIAEPSESPIAGDPSTSQGGNNSFWASAAANSLTATTANYVQVQTPDNLGDAAHWTLVSPDLSPLAGVSSPLVAGIDYTLSFGRKTFAIYGREVGTVIDGFVLSDTNLTATELESALSNQTLSGIQQSLTVSGNYHHNAGATLAVDIDGDASLSKLLVTGAASLAGDLSVSLTGGFIPQESQVYTILDATSLLGQFDNAAPGSRIAVEGGGGSFVVNYDYAQDLVTLSSFVSVLPGDYNDDGVVNAADYTVWRDNLGEPAGTLPNDADGGAIGPDQYATWRANYGATNAASSTTGEAASVPEPSSWILLGVIGLSFRAHRRLR